MSTTVIWTVIWAAVAFVAGVLCGVLVTRPRRRVRGRPDAPVAERPPAEPVPAAAPPGVVRRSLSRLRFLSSRRRQERRMERQAAQAPPAPPRRPRAAPDLWGASPVAAGADPAPRGRPAPPVRVELPAGPVTAVRAPRPPAPVPALPAPAAQRAPATVPDPGPGSGAGWSPSALIADSDDPPDPGAPSDRLAWLRGSDGVGDHLLQRRLTTIGRGEECDIVLNDPSVAARHARVLDEDGVWWLIATGRGTTTVNSRAAEPGARTALADGAVLGLGDLRFVAYVPDAGPPVHAEVTLFAAGHTDRGRRSANQDSFATGPAVAVVADGVGGRPAGDLASRLAVDAVVRGARRELAAVVDELNAQVRARGRADRAVAGMATTLDGLVLRRREGGPWVEGVHVGDGLALLLQDGEIAFRTTPHTLAAQLVAAGQLSAAEERGHGDRHALVRGVGLAETVRPDLWRRPAVAGQRYVLASDGLSDGLRDPEILTHLRDLRSLAPGECARALVEAALRGGSADNVTVVVADIVVG